MENYFSCAVPTTPADNYSFVRDDGDGSNEEQAPKHQNNPADNYSFVPDNGMSNYFSCAVPNTPADNYSFVRDEGAGSNEEPPHQESANNYSFVPESGMQNYFSCAGSNTPSDNYSFARDDGTGSNNEDHQENARDREESREDSREESREESSYEGSAEEDNYKPGDASASIFATPLAERLSQHEHVESQRIFLPQYLIGALRSGAKWSHAHLTWYDRLLAETEPDSFVELWTNMAGLHNDFLQSATINVKALISELYLESNRRLNQDQSKGGV
jgi:hypothetical protein